MTRKTLSLLLLTALGCIATRSAFAQDQPPAGDAVPTVPAPPAGAQAEPQGPPPPIPPYVEGEPVQSQGGGFCFEGPHPVDARVSGGATWDPTPGRHIHPYPPFDLRLFSVQDNCYYFIGDPRDFGYAGESYSYYGAHPVHASHGGGWCFMIGGHHHLWRPWSPYFTTVGPWYYWEGPYDPFFWTYWPYYSFYYRSHYPHYYGGGLFIHGHGRGIAPRITSVPPPPRSYGAWGAQRQGGAFHQAPAWGPRGNMGGRGAFGGGVAPPPRSFAPPSGHGGWGSPGMAAPRSFSPPRMAPPSGGGGGRFGGGAFGGGGGGRFRR